MTVHVGMDLAEIDEVRNSVLTLGDRYLRRVYTDAERRDCSDSSARLAERFAAKEATMKALGCEERLPWKSIEVLRDAAGVPSLTLSGPAAELARDRGVRELTVTLGRTTDRAAAVVVG